MTRLIPALALVLCAGSAMAGLLPVLSANDLIISDEREPLSCWQVDYTHWKCGVEAALAMAMLACQKHVVNGEYQNEFATLCLEVDAWREKQDHNQKVLKKKRDTEAKQDLDFIEAVLRGVAGMKEKEK